MRSSISRSVWICPRGERRSIVRERVRGRVSSPSTCTANVLPTFMMRTKSSRSTRTSSVRSDAVAVCSLRGESKCFMSPLAQRVAWVKEDRGELASTFSPKPVPGSSMLSECTSRWLNDTVPGQQLITQDDPQDPQTVKDDVERVRGISLSKNWRKKRGNERWTTAHRLSECFSAH